MPKIPQSTIDRIRDRSDIVDVISEEVSLKERVLITLVAALFMMKKHLHLVYPPQNKYITASDVVMEEMFLLF
tara:strand:+ start:1720 stop:1938 length:219 start_codon:yes stop_codon:yes gene_type:complete